MHALPRPKDPAAPWPAPDAAFVHLGRSTRPHLLGLAVMALFTAAAVLAAVWPERFLVGGGEQAGQRVMAVVLAVLLSLGLALVLAAMAVAARPHGVAVDASGVWYLDFGTADLVPWARVRGVGVGWRPLRRVPKGSAGAALAQEARHAALRGRGAHGLEVFLDDPREAAGSARLRRLMELSARARAPRPELPVPPLRFAMGRGDAEELGRRIAAGMPGLWIGVYPRPGA
ncbi:hypothetical protein [Allonocardiopsis opalescens]|uniref:PH (Pleckstrin Homology) domain-containing protein n=1 Tax=Allonocardiopsis opalescens TaxID=1144618 RepID=A0A2T0PTU3_9ACTN|nr:hypothetical protein [Allonocardiopsis opalescens]PRX92314.1 hypothetical protein CLV72_11074 [Allonocardiopsis opalescens]